MHASPAMLYSLWSMVILAETAVLSLLLARRIYRYFPAFTCFIAFCVLRSVVLVGLNFLDRGTYSAVYWTAYAPQLVLAIALTLELFNLLFKPFETLPRNTLAHFVEGIVAIAAAGLLFALCWPGAQSSAWMSFLRAMDQCVSLVLFATFALIALFATYFGIPWRHRAFGIVVGFLFHLGVDTAVTVVVAQYGLPSRSAIWPVHMLAFVIACGIWVYYFAIPETPREPLQLEQLQRILAVLERNSRWLKATDLNRTPDLRSQIAKD
jgi:hypothetical protein